MLCSLVHAQPAQQVQQAVQHGAQASGNASASAAHSLAASGQLTSAVVAAPLGSAGAVLGSVGNASQQAAGALADLANQPIGTPLPVADEALSIVPPNQALQQKRTAP